MKLATLNLDEEEKLKQSLLDFVLRVSLHNAPSQQVAVLPEITQLLLEYFR